MRHRSFLLVCTPADLKQRPFQGESVQALVARPRDADRCAFLWTSVGRGFWTERARWSRTRWEEHLGRPEVTFWIARRVEGDLGCFEFTRMRRGIKIQGFGLLPAHRGQGLGGGLLTLATQKAFDTGVRKVWLHTATDDHRNALPNYLAGGYRIVRERELRNPLR